MKIITVKNLLELIANVGRERFMEQLIEALTLDFSRWESFRKSPRHATHYPHGVIELMPCSDDSLYAFKYVNGHPKNTSSGKMSVIALGLLADVDSGYPLMLSEMTLLTAFRTAATSALAARYLARPNSARLAMIGTGAQAEFQLLAIKQVLPIQEVSYFDPDMEAMKKFERHVRNLMIKPIACHDITEAIDGADMVVTATAAKRRNRLLTPAMIEPGTHIHGLGGDCPGKTELDPELLKRCKIVVEYFQQSRDEGEIQNLRTPKVHAELWELVSGKKPGRENDQEITLMDSVGFALEDYSVLRLVYQLAEENGVGEELELIPSLTNPKDLFGLLQ